MDSFQQRSTHNIILRLLSLFFLLIIKTDIAVGHNKVRNVTIPGLGVLSGVYSTHDSEVTNFLGIPYAKPPIGDLRFMLPQAIYWNGTLDAQKMPPACIQPDTKPPISVSEDCLYLNIYAPGNMTDPSANRSVMVWIHGGDFTSGYANSYKVKALIKNGDVIVVTINYRLNIFGFLTAGHPVFKGNAGLHDQVMALKWVKQNIRPFGGDPNKITVFGQSAGAVSIYTLLASPNITDGLFARAIMQSGMIPPVTEPIPAFHAIAKLTSCPHIHTHGGTHALSILNQITCMRNKTTQELLAVATDPQAPKFGPVIDGVFLNSNILEQLVTSNSKVPCLIGLNKNEFVLNANESIKDADALKKRLASLESQSFDSMAVQMMLAKFLTSDLEGTYTDVLNSRMLVELQKVTMSLSRTKEVFMYYFTHHPSFSYTNKNTGAGNANELPFVFGDMSSATPDEMTLSQDIIHIWSSFARDGVPQLPNGVKWPPYEKTNRTYVDLNVNITADNVKQRLREGDRIFWNELIPKMMKMNAKPQDMDMHNHMMTTESSMHHHHKMDSGSIAWGMSDQAVRDLLLSLLIIAIFLAVICVTLVTILCKVRTIKLQSPKQNGGVEGAIDGGNINQAFTNEPTKSKPESITAL